MRAQPAERELPRRVARCRENGTAGVRGEGPTAWQRTRGGLVIHRQYAGTVAVSVAWRMNSSSVRYSVFTFLFLVAAWVRVLPVTLVGVVESRVAVAIDEIRVGQVSR